MPSSLTTALNLSHNCFSGSIPSSSFSKSPQLEILDLSHNNFSGPVPDSLTTLQFLTLLDLSNNNLTGTLPTFDRWVNVIITGNALLSNSSREGISNSDSNSKMQPSLATKLFFELCAIVGIFVGVFLGNYGFDKIQFDL
ncbi:leucine-rich repeat receptor-like protein kinase PXL2 [Carex littledalei]|uniref:Leucine-rich repeat receptor-like protein kinase PXL2 n=1 Tax=Carex littledalei TaxID=544730 RepID=A0A833REX3_9POAL|nr:leucine-rich repeat receptor-like protein kinase PXL2 [Carex littledalei]